MSDELRPRRSVLYLPGANERALAKAPTLATDALILDLEDAVAPDAKAEARDRIVAALDGSSFGSREVAVRSNGLDTDWYGDDVRAIASAGPDAMLVPKVSSADDVHAAADALDRAGADDTIALWAMLETPAAVRRAAEIAGASERLTVLVMGTNDLAKELRTQAWPDRGPLLTSLAWCVLAARETGTAIVDGVFNDLGDAEGFEAECRQGRAYGFDGKTLIHPKQLETCNRVFAPSDDEVAHARRVIDAFEEALAEGRGVATVDGRLIEQLHVDQARRDLAMADAIAERDAAG
jgi:citrate lyase subunit beta/citryl-CoA lyase